MGFPFGVIFNSALLDHIRAKALQRDPDALDALFRLLPRNPPPGYRKWWRDREIRNLLVELRDGYPEIKATTRAKLLAEAGRQIIDQRRSKLSGHRFGFDILSPAELDELAARIRQIGELTQVPWLKWGQIHQFQK